MSETSISWCGMCLYYGKSTGTCDFILMEDHRRPCPAGQGCGARRLRKDVRKSMNPKWDTSIGKEMFLGGRSDREIADFFGISVSTVSYQHRKNWEADSAPPPLRNRRKLFLWWRSLPPRFRPLRSRLEPPDGCLMFMRYWKRPPGICRESTRFVPQKRSAAFGAGRASGICRRPGPPLTTY